MRSFHIRLLLFVAIVFIAVVSLDRFLDAGMKKLRYDDASVWNDIYSGKASADILVCGSSRAATHIDVSAIEQASGCSCYNLGMMGHNFILEEARYRIYRQHNQKPRLIIFSLDYESLQMRADLFNHTQFIAYLKDPILSEATKHYSGFSDYDYKLPLLRYVGEQELIIRLIKDRLHPERNVPDRRKGFYGRDMHWDRNVDQVLDTLQPYVVHPDSISLHRFRSFIESCRADNIPLIFVHTPVHPVGQQKVKNREAMIALYRRFSKEYAIPFLDYASDTMCSNKQYFMNSTHLNALGASVFTRKLISDLEATHLLLHCRP
ncbi:hypothetical protein [Rurimicrobium arvi]|uniref:SGNH/GDSL hydrolase family protein n=1 Tax=Rurimicrobium arvi TaxID=2049916 RepID=A0ABP8MGB2_9BACT